MLGKLLKMLWFSKLWAVQCYYLFLAIIFRTELNGMTNIYGAKQLQESPVPKDTILIQMELLYFFLFISYLPLK